MTLVFGYPTTGGWRREGWNETIHENPLVYEKAQGLRCGFHQVQGVKQSGCESSFLFPRQGWEEEEEEERNRRGWRLIHGERGE